MPTTTAPGRRSSSAVRSGLASKLFHERGRVRDRQVAGEVATDVGRRPAADGDTVVEERYLGRGGAVRGRRGQHLLGPPGVPNGTQQFAGRGVLPVADDRDLDDIGRGE